MLRELFEIWLRRERLYQETIDQQRQAIAALQARVKDAHE